MSEQIVRANDVVRRYGDLIAVNNVSLEVKPGECFGLLGPNGAGKSTLIRMLYGARQRDGGELQVLGLDPQTDFRTLKRRLGVVPQENCLDDQLSVFENLKIFGAYHGLYGAKLSQRINSLLEWMSLESKRMETVKALSGGMQRRLAFVRALLHEPEFLILDEPTTGLDPAVRHLLWERVHELSRRGISVLVTTHYMEEAQRLCDRLVIMDEGKITAKGSPKDLVLKHCPGFVAIFSKETLEQSGEISKIKDDSRFEVITENIQISVRSKRLEDLTHWIESAKQNPLQIRPSNLEDVFLKITGKELGDHD